MKGCRVVSGMASTVHIYRPATTETGLANNFGNKLLQIVFVLKHFHRNLTLHSWGMQNISHGEQFKTENKHILF